MKNAFDLAEQSIKDWEKALSAGANPGDIEEKIEQILECLEYIKGWEPSDADIVSNNSVGTAWHDGCF